MAATLQALLGFIAWTLLLLVLMEAIRSWLVLSGAEPANGFNPELLEKAGFGVGNFGNIHCHCQGYGGARFGKIMPTRIDSKRDWCISMNYNS